MRNKVLTLVLVTSALSSGCTMIPDYIQPDFSAAQSWNDVPGYTVPVGEELAMQMTWQEFFTSEELRVVISTALENNKDLATAALNIDEARALYN